MPVDPIVKSSAASRGGASRTPVARATAMLTCALAIATLLGGCAFGPKTVPPNAIEAARVPAAWVPVAGIPDENPRIVGARFSSLDIALGDDWDGDVVTSTDVAQVFLHTTLFDIEATRTAPGRFHFLEHVIDDPAFIVRPYSLNVIARDANGLKSELDVPFRIRGRGVPALRPS